MFGAGLTHHAATNICSKMMGNRVFAATHSRGCIFYAFATRRKTRNRSFITAAPFGKLPDAILMGALTVPSRAHENVGLGIVKTIFRRDGEAWATGLLSHASSDRWGTEAIVRILTALPETKWTWQGCGRW